MATMRTWRPWQNQAKVSVGGQVSSEVYADKVFRHAIDAPFDTLANPEMGANRLSEAFAMINLAAYLQEKICVAWGKLPEEELLPDSVYMKAIATEEDKLEQLVSAGKLDAELKKVSLSYFKIAWLLKKIQSGKGESEELEV